MPIAYSYGKIDQVSGDDLIIISDKSTSYKTKSVTVDELGQYFNANPVTSVYSKLETFINFQQLIFFDGQSAYEREIELVPAPGANKVIIIDSVFAYMQPGTIAFDFNTVLSIGLSGQQNNGFLPRPTIQASMLNTSIGNAYNFVDGFSSIAPFPETSPPGYNYANKGIVLTNPFATTVTQGNSTLKLNIIYRVVNI